MKKCTKCKQNKEPTDFHKNKSKKDGLSNRCKICSNQVSKDWVEKNRKRHNLNQKNGKMQRTAKGLCRHCLNKNLDTSTLCEKHWFEDISRNHFGTTKYGEYLKEVAEKQNYKCIYTDEILRPSDNMSLDHIISNFDDPTKKEDLSNVQWVTRDINLIKNKLSHDNFINLCHFISNKFKNRGSSSRIYAFGDGSSSNASLVSPSLN